jgi:hypothetical protein
MKTRMTKKSVLIIPIFVMGIFFILGSIPPGFGDRKERPQVNYENLDLAKKTEYDSLTERRVLLEAHKKKKHEEYRIADKKCVESQGKDSRVKNEISKISSELTKVQTEIEKVEKRIDKIAEESNKSCFPSDIQVLMKDGTHKPISSIAKGDEVVVYDIAKDTISNSTVNEVMISSNNHYYVLNNSIKATAYERFLTQNGWKKIREIKEGDKIFNGNDYISVNHIEKVWVDDEVYNLNINSNHNFFVSYDAQNNMLVHNSGGGGGGGSDGGGK